MPQVKLNTIYANGQRNAQPGDVIDCPGQEAADLIAGGYASPHAAPADPAPQVADLATADQATDPATANPPGKASAKPASAPKAAD